ncbi:Glycine betaine uptake system permease protein YehY [Methylobacterium tardum]|uniref:ABC transporter permease n=1 Tax=Methylobacterium tardum TaxID=374432 RepID=A0AA37WRY1_9HYPH|nr:ABC transporter permease [Methylobacterium tardum]URD36320.1 ABC transporter permease [Methylobacterium tardum]GJE47764.1 Glycine betaine uptake system permease protein YehY [Methylobacterium tardum]GLS69597.1 ABC transporter permease [Methylobacterium tardum]
MSGHMAARARAGFRPARPGADPLGSVFAALLGLGLLALPLVTARPNRIALGTPLMAWSALPLGQALALGAVLGCVAPLLALRIAPGLRLAAGSAALGLLCLAAGWAADHLTPPGDRYGRISLDAGWWLAFATAGLAAGDGLARLRPSPALQIGALALVAALVGLVLRSGFWDNLSVLREYVGRSDTFGREVRTHAGLALSSVAAAALVGIPAAILAHPVPTLRAALLSVFNVVQTIPSMALFGMLIAPLAWIGRTVPGAADLGIAGIGAAPAFVALFAYALLPVTAATVAGLDAVPGPVRDAARGVGMTDRQRLVQVELPLALPAILTGIRIVLVQNIGLAVIAGLVGGGGLGVYVFQGISQNAGDLVLLGALPTVAMASGAAVLLDAVIDLSRGRAADRTP